MARGPAAGRSVGGQPTIPSIPPLSRRLIIGIAAVIAVLIIAAIIVTTLATKGGQATSGGNFTRPANAVRIGDMLFTVVSVKTLDVKPPKAHLKYVAVELTAQNVGQLTTGNWSIELIDSDGVQNVSWLGSWEYAQFGQTGQRARDFSINGLKPGAQVQGPVIFTMLADAKPVRLQYSSSGASGVIPLPK